MTETLNRLLHEQAELAQLRPVDLDEVTRVGSRAVRRRRWAAGAATVATLAVVGGVAAVVQPEASTPQPADPAPPVVVPEFTALTWASGEVLHTPAGDIPVGHQITAFARSEAGYVVASGNEVYTVSGGEVRAAGTVSAESRLVPTLYGDTDGTLVAWATPSSFEVRDLATGATLSLPGSEPAALIGVDGRTLYALEGAEVVAIDVDSGERTVLPGQPVAAEDGVVLQRGVVGPSGGEATRVLLSPTARWATLDLDSAGGATALVFDVRAGERVRLPLPEGQSKVVEWLDDDSVSVLSLPEPDGGYRLLKCHVPIRACEVEASYDGPVVLPTGEPYLLVARD